MKRFAVLSLLLILSACAKPAVRYEFAERDGIRSQYLHFTPKVIVYLPKDYFRSEASYPVLYAHDGQNLFTNATSFSGEWQLDENITALQQAGLLGGIIVVGIYNTGNRITDYTPTKISNQFVMNQGGGLSNYAKFIIDELKPYIDRTYRTLPDREHTGVMGSSLGGLASFYLLGWYPQVFSRAAAISPSFWWDNVRVTNDMAHMTFPPDVKLYIDGGWKEDADESSMVNWMRAVYLRLVARGLRDLDNVYYYEDPNGQHNEANWARRGKMPLLYLFGKFSPVVTGISLTVQPDIVGIGDTSKLAASVKFTNGMLYTRFTGNYGVNNADAQVDPLGNLRGLRAGDVTVTMNVLGTNVARTLTIRDHSRNTVYLTFSVFAPQPVRGLKLVIVKESGMATNITVPFVQVSPTNATARLVRPAGAVFIYSVMDGEGREAYNAEGNSIRSLVKTIKDSTITVRVAEFR